MDHGVPLSCDGLAGEYGYKKHSNAPGTKDPEYSPSEDRKALVHRSEGPAIE